MSTGNSAVFRESSGWVRIANDQRTRCVQGVPGGVPWGCRRHNRGPATR